MCRKNYVVPKMSSPWAAESSDMINNPGLGQKFVDEVLTIRASSLVAYWLTCRPGEASEDGQRWWYGHHGDPKLFATFTALIDMKGDWMRNV
jgi:hypothetical protein